MGTLQILDKVYCLSLLWETKRGTDEGRAKELLGTAVTVGAVLLGNVSQTVQAGSRQSLIKEVACISHCFYKLLEGAPQEDILFGCQDKDHLNSHFIKILGDTDATFNKPNWSPDKYLTVGGIVVRALQDAEVRGTYRNAVRGIENPDRWKPSTLDLSDGHLVSGGRPEERVIEMMLYCEARALNIKCGSP